MVKYGSIIKAIDLYVTKCPTIAEIKSKLESLDQSEKESLLKEKNLLNDGEDEYYRYLLKKEKYMLDETARSERQLQKAIDENKKEGWVESCKKLVKRNKEELEEYQSEMFQFERRIYDGYKKQDSMKIDYDESEYDIEDQMPISSEILELEQAQIESQKNLNLSEDEVSCLNFYFGNGSEEFNSRLYGGKQWNSLEPQYQRFYEGKYKDIDNTLHKAIDRSDGLLQDTILFHGSKFDVTKTVGDDIKFNGYVSATFQEDIARDFDSVSKKPFYVYKMLLPKGTKGICGNDRSNGSLKTYTKEHEYLLDKGQKYKIVDIDYETHTVTLVPTVK